MAKKPRSGQTATDSRVLDQSKRIIFFTQIKQINIVYNLSNN